MEYESETDKRYILLFKGIWFCLFLLGIGIVVLSIIKILYIISTFI